MPKSRPPYAAEFRRQMVELVRSGRTPEALARGVRAVGPGHPESGGAGRPGCRRAHRRPAHRGA